MNQRFADFIKHPLFTAFAGGLPGIALALWSLYAVHQLGVGDKSREFKQAAVNSFLQSSSELLTDGGQFVTALNGSSSLKEAKERIRDASARQEIAIDQLSKLFKDSAEIKEYAGAIRGFADTSEVTSAPIQIGAWIHSFDQVVVARSKLQESLYKAVDI